MYRQNKHGIIAITSESDLCTSIPSTTSGNICDTLLSFVILFLGEKNAAGLGPACGGLSPADDSTNLLTKLLHRKKLRPIARALMERKHPLVKKSATSVRLCTKKQDTFALFYEKMHTAYIGATSRKKVSNAFNQKTGPDHPHRNVQLARKHSTQVNSPVNDRRLHHEISNHVSRFRLISQASGIT